MEREYIKIPKSSPMPNNIPEFEELSDDFWKREIFYHLLSFYQNYDSKELKEKIELEKKKKKSDIEDLVATYIRNHLRRDKLFGLKGMIVVGGVNNDLTIKGLYDISFLHSYWDKEFHFECKNLGNSQDWIDKYVCYNTYKKKPDKKYIFDGGVLRFFNGKYAQNFDFGGMIGFVIDGDILEIKNKILRKLADKFEITPEGDLLAITDCSVEKNDFTFDSNHKRDNKEFLIHHLLFDFTK